MLSVSVTYLSALLETYVETQWAGALRRTRRVLLNVSSGQRETRRVHPRDSSIV